MNTEDKYISVNEFKKSLARLTVEGGSLEVRSAIAKTLSDAVPQFLDDEPAADVQPVKRGEWEKSDLVPCTKRCSGCKFTIDSNISLFYNYCPNCGARMDGGENK